MKLKRILPLLCAAVMIMIPATAFADTTSTLNLDPSFTPDSLATWNNESNTLTLKGCNFVNTEVDKTKSEKANIKLEYENTIGSLMASGGYWQFNIGGKAGAKLVVKEYSSGSNNNDSLTISDGVKVTFENGLYYGASGGSDSFLTVQDKGSELTINGSVNLQHYDIKNGASLKIVGGDQGKLTVTSGGELKIDKTSTLAVTAGLEFENKNADDLAWLEKYLPEGYYLGQKEGDLTTATVYTAEGVQADTFTVKYQTEDSGTDPNPGDNPGTNPKEDTTDQPKNESSPKTGDTTPLAATLVILVASSLLAVTLKKSK